MMTDPIADMLTRIRNANQMRNATVSMPSSNLKAEIAKLLLEEGYIENYEVSGEVKKELTEISLTEEQIRAFRLADNKVSEIATWDIELLDIELDNILDIDMGMFDFMKTEEINVDDFFTEAEEKPKEEKIETVICPYCNKEFVKE